MNATSPIRPPGGRDRPAELYQSYESAIARRTDRLFVGQFLFQWVARIILALLVAPNNWYGAESETHVHVWVALGEIISSCPVHLGLTQPARRSPAMPSPSRKCSWARC